MATSGKVASGSGGESGSATAYFEFRWSAQNAGVGKTKVNWELWRCGRHSSPKRYAHSYDIDITYKETMTADKTILLSKSWGFVDNDTYTFDEEKAAAKDKTGSFTVFHNAQGIGTFTVNFKDIRIYYNDQRIGSVEHTITLDKNYPYTNCTAPTTVTVARKDDNGSRVKPGEKIIISWIGANGGTSNGIDGYQVQYKIGSGGWVSVSTKTTGSSIEAAISTSATRGASVIAQVKTIGKISGYDSGFRESDASCKVNTLPGKPAVTVAKKLFASTSNENLNIKASAGNSNDTTQTAKIAYRIRSKESVDKGTGTEITIYNGGSYSITNKPNGGAYLYEFWTYDGLEYSSCEAFYVIKNTSAPSVSNIKITGMALSSQNKPTGVDYIISPSITWQKGEGGYTNIENSNNSYRVGIWYSTSTNFAEENRTNILVQQTTSTALSYTIPDVRAYIPITQSQGYYYKIYVQRYDGVEWGLGYSTDTYYVTQIPRTTHISNDIYGVPNTDSEFHQYFSKKLNIYLEYDQGYNRINFIAKTTNNQTRVGPLALTLSTLIEKNASYLYCGLGESSLQSWTRGSEHKIYIAPKYVAGGKEMFSAAEAEYLQANGKSTRIRTFTPPNDLAITWTGDIKPFTADNTDVTFQSIHTNQTKWYWAYGFNTTPVFEVYTEYKGKIRTISEQYTYVIQSADTGKITVKGSELYKLFVDQSADIFNFKSISSYKVIMGIKATNAFSETYGGKVADKNVSFDEKITISDQTLYAIDSKGTYVFFGEGSDVRLLKEGVEVHLSAKVKSYHGTPNGLRAQLYSDSTLVFNGAYGSGGFTKENVSVVSHKNPIEYSFDQKIGSIPQITKNMYLTSINIICTDVRSQTITNSYSGNDVPASFFRRHTTGNANIIGGTYQEITLSDNQKQRRMAIELSVSDFGITEPNSSYGEICACNITMYYTGKNNEIKSTGLINSPSLPVTLNWEKDVEEIGPFSRVYVTIKIDYTAKGAKTSYTTRTGEFIVYNSLPTVSYRKNQIGINCDPTDAPSSNIQNASLIVGAHSGKSKVVFKSANKECVVDLSDGKITEFVIDCGAW